MKLKHFYKLQSTARIHFCAINAAFVVYIVATDSVLYKLHIILEFQLERQNKPK